MLPKSDLSNFQCFRLLTWKNFLILKNNRNAFLFDILIPIFFWFFLINERLQIQTKQIEEEIFKPEDLPARWQNIMKLVKKRHDILEMSNGYVTDNVFAPQAILGYAPFEYKDFKDILTAALAILGGGLKLKGFSNCEQLESALSKEHHFAGVCFLDVVSFDYTDDDKIEYNFDDDDPLNNLNYTILMPSELRTFSENVGIAWTTSTPFMSHLNYTDYLEEGFVSLQAAIERAFIDYRLKGSENKGTIPELTLQPFPNVEHYEDIFVRKRNSVICILLVFCFLFPIIRLTWRITHEKRSVLIRYTIVLGAENWIHYLAWLLHGLFVFFCNAMVSTLILKLTWSIEYPAVLPATSSLAFLVFLFAYSLVAVSHCILISAFFSNAFQAAAVSGSLWILTAIPLLSFDYRTPLTPYTWIWIILFPNTTLGYTIGTFIWNELSDIGFQFSQMLSREFPFEHLNAGTAIGLFFSQSSAYIIVALICEKHRAHYLYRWQKKSKHLMASSKRRVEVVPTLAAFGAEETRVYEVEKDYKNKLATIDGVSLDYGQFQVVTDVTLDLFENNITVLMGHNGCGKSSLLSMITGVAPISLGAIHINGFDCSKSKEGRYELGACMHDLLLFEFLTIEDQIIFFSRLKGMTWKQAQLQADKYCRVMNLTGIRRVLTKDLTLGLKQQLAICCAFAGNSKIVIMDEPNYGLDLSATRQMLELLTAEKIYRSILISTNDTSFADLIADRVAVMAKGQLKCNGNIAFLKDIYSFGGRLIIIKRPECRMEPISEILKQYMPNILLESDIGNSVAFLVPNRYTNSVGLMLDHIERQRDELNIETYALENISINDVVLAMGTNYPNDYDPKRQWRIRNGETPFPTAAFEAFERKYPQVRNRLRAYRYFILLRLIPHFRKKWLALGNIFLPTFFLIILFGVYFHLNVRERLTSVYFHPSSYEHSSTIIGRLGDLNENMQAIHDNMKQWIFWMVRVHNIIDIGTQSLLGYLKELPEPMLTKLHREFLVALIFSNDTIAIYYNTRSYNIVPMALNMANNAVARTLIDRHASIAAYFTPLDYQVPDSYFQWSSNYGVSFTYVPALFFAFLFSWNVCIYYLAMERTSNFPLLLHTAGITVPDFWICTLWFDTTLGAIGIGFAFVVTYAFQSKTFYFELVVITFIALFCGCIVLHSVHYVFTCFLDSPINCYYAVLLYDCIGIAVIILRDTDISLMNLPEALTLFIHPFIPIGILVRNLMYVLFLQQYCQNEDIIVFDEVIQDSSKLCDIKQMLDSHRISYTILALILYTCVSWLLIFLIEYKRKWLRFGICRIPHDNDESAWQDYRHRHTLNEPNDNVRANMEVDKLTHLESCIAPLVVNRIGKNYGIKEALHRISFVLDRHSVCGILGSNASGKSELLQVISTLRRPSYGRIQIKGIDVVHNPFNVHKHFSLCPTNLDYIRAFSACEIMEIYANLKGIPRNKVPRFCESMAKSLGFYEFYDKILDVCSPGIRKRVAIALAIIGHPDLILLDEPTAGVDSYGQLLLHNALKRVCQSGSTVLFTTKNAAECQYFCDKVYVLINGHMTVGGTVEHILETNIYGYELQIRVKVIEHKTANEDYELEYRTNSNAIMRVMTMVQSMFKQSILKSVDGNLLNFVLPHRYGIANIYLKIRRKEFNNLIDSFGIHYASLQTIYLEILDQFNMEEK